MNSCKIHTLSDWCFKNPHICCWKETCKVRGYKKAEVKGWQQNTRKFNQKIVTPLISGSWNFKVKSIVKHRILKSAWPVSYFLSFPFSFFLLIPHLWLRSRQFCCLFSPFPYSLLFSLGLPGQSPYPVDLWVSSWSCEKQFLIIQKNYCLKNLS